MEGIAAGFGQIGDNYGRKYIQSLVKKEPEKPVVTVQVLKEEKKDG